MRVLPRRQFVVALCAGLAACVPGESTAPLSFPTEDAPALPPIGALSIDVSYFTDAAASAANGNVNGSTGEGEHWSHARLRMAAADADVLTRLAVPVATWTAAATVTPTFDAVDRLWHWRFSVSHGGLTYEGDLSGVVAGNQASFRMKLSQASLGLDGFVWYTAVAPVTMDSGVWEFFDPQRPGDPVGRIDWTHPDPDVWTLRFLAAGAAENEGDVLDYEANGTSRRVRYDNASTGDFLEVFWDSVSGAGHIIADGYNGGAKSCWGDDQNDVPCPG